MLNLNVNADLRFLNQITITPTERKVINFKTFSAGRIRLGRYSDETAKTRNLFTAVIAGTQKYLYSKVVNVNQNLKFAIVYCH